MKRFLNLIVVCTLASTIWVKAAEETERNNFNLLEMTGGLFAMFENNADVYICSVSKLDAIASPNNVEHGAVTLTVNRTLLGKSRQGLVLPYGFSKGVLMGGATPTWPNLRYIGKSNLLCVVVAGLKDPNSPAITNINEAATEVLVVGQGDDPKVAEMETCCQIYAAKDTSTSVALVTRYLSDERPAVQDFASETLVLRLGKSLPDRAIRILRTELAQSTNAQAVSGSQRLIMYVRINFALFSFDKKKFLCRCLATLSGSSAEPVRTAALDALALEVDSLGYRPDLHLQDGLTPSDKSALIQVLDAEATAKDPAVISNVRRLQEWLTK